MEHTYEDLSKMTVAQLREIAKGLDHDAVRGYSTMHKEQLLKGICSALGIEGRAHHDVVGINKQQIKAKIQTLKSQRGAAIEAHDHKELKVIRRKIHRLKRRIHKATV